MKTRKIIEAWTRSNWEEDFKWVMSSTDGVNDPLHLQLPLIIDVDEDKLPFISMYKKVRVTVEEL